MNTIRFNIIVLLTLTSMLVLPQLRAEAVGRGTELLLLSESSVFSSTMYKFRRKKDGLEIHTNIPNKYRNNSAYEELAPIKLGGSRIHTASKSTKRSTKKKANISYQHPRYYTQREIQNIIAEKAKAFDIDENLIYALIKAESDYQPHIVSKAGACGLMQLMPGTAAEMGVVNIFDPAENINGGTKYLHNMLKTFNGDTQLALAGYNAGPEAVKKYHGIPPYKETQGYVKKVMRLWQEYSGGSKRKSGFLNLTVKRPQRRTFDNAIVVHFHSGLTQPADKIEEKKPYYYVHYGSRVYAVRMDLVKEIKEKG